MDNLKFNIEMNELFSKYSLIDNKNLLETKSWFKNNIINQLSDNNNIIPINSQDYFTLEDSTNGKNLYIYLQNKPHSFNIECFEKKFCFKTLYKARTLWT